MYYKVNYILEAMERIPRYIVAIELYTTPPISIVM